MRVIAQHNLWFRGRPHFRNYRIDGRKMISVDPLLGQRDSSDAAALAQEMQWLHRYTGRDGSNFIYSLEWFLPGNLIDRNLANVFLPQIESCRARWNIFYDPVLAVRQRGLENGFPIDFARRDVTRMFKQDIAYLDAAYFSHPNYWHIDGKPVLYIWSARNAIRNVDPVFRQVRNQGVFLLGDVFGGHWEFPEVDAATGFVAATPDLIGTVTEVPRVFDNFEIYFDEVRSMQDDEGRPYLVPAVSGQYDDTNFQSLKGGFQTRLLATNRQDIERFFRLAERSADPIHGERYVWLGTTNNWAEGATLLPTVLRRPRYLSERKGLIRMGNYAFEHLEAVHSVFFRREPKYKGPKIETTQTGAVRFFDCDVLGRLKVIGSVDNAPHWPSGRNLETQADGTHTWLPRNPKNVRMRFVNLDRKIATLEIR